MKWATIDKDGKMMIPPLKTCPSRSLPTVLTRLSLPQIKSGEKANVVRFAQPEDQKTLPVTVVDADGNAVSDPFAGYAMALSRAVLGLCTTAVWAYLIRARAFRSILPGKRRFTQCARQSSLR